jgi:SAM-dependent methyltransferase
MSNFSAAWLALREPADRRARSTRVTRAIADALPRERPIEVLDLGAGTGSNARYLAEYFRSPQTWLLVDRDATLLDAARERRLAGTTTRVVDLSSIATHGDLFAGRDLVTASALLDLVSEDWLRVVIARCREEEAAVLFALSYDGRITCSPADPEDRMIRDLQNQHQRTDKGFGPALGPDAAGRASQYLEAQGYRVLRDRSDWVLGPEMSDLQRQLIDGWTEAATAVDPRSAETITAWRERRLGRVREGRSHLVVGHEDLAAFIA